MQIMLMHTPCICKHIRTYVLVLVLMYVLLHTTLYIYYKGQAAMCSAEDREQHTAQRIGSIAECGGQGTACTEQGALCSVVDGPQTYCVQTTLYIMNREGALCSVEDTESIPQVRGQAALCSVEGRFANYGHVQSLQGSL